MKLTLAQLNPTVGDLKGNAELLREAARQAIRDGADLLVAPEMFVSGYPPKDLLLRDGFVDACDRAVEELARSLDANLGVLVGHPTRFNAPRGRIANAASLLFRGRIQTTLHKKLLPNYDVFDERRYFRPAETVTPVLFRGRKLGIHICEDAWWGEPSTSYRSDPKAEDDPVAQLAAQGVDFFINVSASPFELAKPGLRFELVTAHVRRHGVPFVFVNQVGGNDDLVFDGHSFVVDAGARKVLELARFKPEVRTFDVDNLPKPEFTEPLSREAAIHDALVLGLGDYVRKCGFCDCVLGLSGGIDSALTAYVAAAAIGREHVHTLLMPGRYSSKHSVEDARRLAESLGIDYDVIPIDEVHSAYERTAIVGDELTSDPVGLANQNLQARIRGAVVMIRSNRNGWLPLATGNKSELAVGYCTLYGDMAGGFAVLCDVLKRDVYAVARYVNERVAGRELIPESTLNKAPSAELAPNQFDQDVLPPYPILDAILEGLIEKETSVAKMAEKYPLDTVRWVASRLDRNEFKRRQMPPGIKLSQRAFGSGRRMPMAAEFDYG